MDDDDRTSSLNGFTPLDVDTIKCPNAKWRAIFYIVIHKTYAPEVKEMYIRDALCNSGARWKKEEMQNLALTIIECATDPPLPVNAGDSYAIVTKMLCDSYYKYFDGATKLRFVACFKSALNKVFKLYWGKCHCGYCFVIGPHTRVDDSTVERAHVLCKFIAALNLHQVISHDELKAYFYDLYTNAITVHHLRAIDAMLGTAGPYLWADLPDPVGNAELFVNDFKLWKIHQSRGVAIASGNTKAKDYIDYIATRARNFAAFCAKTHSYRNQGH